MVVSCLQRGPRFTAPLKRHPRFAALLFLIATTALCLASSAVLAQPSAAPPSVAKKADPPVLIGPSRVTLVGGKTIEGIAVFRETDRVRVILDDGTEIVLDPSKVVSVVALADLPDAPPAAKTAAKPAAKGAATVRRGTSATGTIKVHDEPPGGKKTTSTRKAAAAALEEGADVGSAGGGGAEAESAKAKEDRQREIEELAGMLQSAIANAALDGAGGGGPDDGADGEGKAQESGAGATLSPAPPPSTENDETKKPYKPKPEDFDATRAVNKAGYRFLGPKGKVPETPPQTDFPKPAAPTTDLGFDADKWRPTSGFSSTATWPKQLPPATSFPNRLSGLDRPITSFGPRWWAPAPTRWSSSIFPQAWQPKDAFAQDQDRKSPPQPPAENPPTNSNK